MLFWEPIIWLTPIFLTEEVLEYHLILGSIGSLMLWFSAICGLAYRREKTAIIFVFMVAEIMFLGSIMFFLLLSIIMNAAQLQVMALLVLTVAAAETAIALSLLFVYHRLTDRATFHQFAILRF
jgi:NADH:ubiquinone oxidoreductase subunit K